MQVKIIKNIPLGKDSINLNGVELITIENLYIEKGEIANIVMKTDNGWFVELYGDRYFVPKENGIEIK